MFQKKLVAWFDELTIKDVSLVGGKNASLGEMYQKLTQKGVDIPYGFAITSFAYRLFLKENGLDEKIREILKDLDTKSISNLKIRGQKIRSLILNSHIPKEVEQEIIDYYKKLSQKYHTLNVGVAVRSSATAEDLPDASFAGQQATFLNISGNNHLLKSVKECFASLFTNRAISYRTDKGFGHLKVYLSVGIQKMVSSDKASSGVMFTLDPDTGFRNVVVINSAWGLGELVVQGQVIPDEIMVFKPTKAIISKNLGSKDESLIYDGENKTRLIKNSPQLKQQFTLSDKEILQLSEWAIQIENHYKKPMDIEWAKDGETNRMYIVQARPETIHAAKNISFMEDYQMHRHGKLLAQGIAVGTKIAQGKAHVIQSAAQIGQFKQGEVLVTKITDPDWEPIMKKAQAIVTDEGGRTSHAAIVSRELGIPCIVGTQNSTKCLENSQTVTADCSNGANGLVYEGEGEWEVKKYSVSNIKRPKTKIMINIGSPDEAFKNSFLPNDGVGLAREEFIIASKIKIHPQALLNYDSLDKNTKAEIDKLTTGYKDKTKYYIDKLASGIARIGAAFYPKPVIVRFSDFKTNEYSSLIGGKLFEPKEENPMIGFRGASRYYDPRFEQSFGLECQAIKKVREGWGLTNVIVMIPFCRTLQEGKKVLETMAKYGLKKGQKGLKVYMMAEIPSDIILADEFLKIFDGFSIGSNDLTQLTLGMDRDNADLSKIANEQDPAVKQLIEKVIKVSKVHKKYVGICGQAPSDYPEFAKFLVRLGIESISLNPDTVIKTTLAILSAEKLRSNPRG
ncbi:phosphoenolpyruvate synthase [Candidatus Daviesbacteria bacterium]|nr:phosphoenolpyruvate synthase [Candidatus Daviesbacteria bacterium]